MNDYSDTMLEQTRLCSGCKKMYYLEPGVNQCSTCHGRGAANREKLRATAVVVPCGKPGCTHSKSADNVYCGLHQICVFVDECANAGTRPCAKYLRGCRVQLSSDYLNRSCAECLEKERVRDHAARSAVVSDVVDGFKQCSVCCKSNPVDCYVGANGQDTKTCKACRDEFARQNEKRDKEHVRELDRKNSKKPERVAVKNEWVKANPEKVALIDLNRRNRMYGGGIDLTIEQFESITKQPCYYCGIIQDKGFNGIDRMDSTKGYEIDNCVSCCTECNMMKGAVDNITFIQRVEHILTHNSMITNGKRYPEAFSNQSGSYYSKYKTNAEQRNYIFELSEEQYYDLIKENCYICGKKTDENHMNGIDRFDNDIGYTLANANACCGQCNIMKKEMDYNVLFDKLKNIYENSIHKTQSEPSVYITNILTPNKNKKSKEEIREASRVKKENQRQAMREKYGNEEYKKMRAEELAKFRKDKQNNE
jgi:hypothetical protein